MPFIVFLFYLNFLKNDCVDGYLREDAFKNIYSQFFPRGTESSSYCHFVFIAFDIETKGAITFTVSIKILLIFHSF